MLAIGLLLSLAPQVWAQAADVGTKICRDVQLLAQDAVEAGAPYRNHGALVATAARTQAVFLQTGSITEACSACIMSPFAQRIPITEQEPCGSERLCGDGEIHPGEACDDGNTVAGKCCDASCHVEVGCPCAAQLQQALAELAGDGAAVAFTGFSGTGTYFIDGSCNPSGRFGFLSIGPTVCQLSRRQAVQASWQFPA